MRSRRPTEDRRRPSHDRASAADGGLLRLAAGLVADDAGEGAALAVAAQGVTDWSAVCAAAVGQGLSALLYARLEAVAGGPVDEKARESLREMHAASQTLATRSLADLLRVIGLLERQEIRVMAVKGPVQSQVLYGDPGLRQSVDLDLVVEPVDVVKARNVLADEGFTFVEAQRRVPTDVLLRNENELTLVGPGGKPLVELHWRLAGRLAWRSLPADELMARSQAIEVAGRTVLTSDEGDTVILLCAHACQHSWEKLEMMVAVVAAARRVGAGRWPALLDRAAGLKCLRRTLVGLCVAHETLGVALPVEVRLRTAPDPAVRRLAAAAGNARRVASSSPGPAGLLLQTAWYARLDGSLRSSVIHLWLRGVTPGMRDWTSLPLPPRLSCLYYLWRPVRLMGKFAALRRHGRPAAGTKGSTL